MSDEFQQESTVQIPLVIVNFKTYLEATGEKALSLAKTMQMVSNETGVTMIPAVQLADLRMVAQAVDLPVFAQHVDGVDTGSNTGHVLAEAVRDAGAAGTLLNHSENRLELASLENSFKAAKRVGLQVVICAENAEEGKSLSELMPDFIAVEPPELIGGNVSVTSANPGLITDSVEMIGKGRVLIGAGVKTGEDVKVGKDLGAVGVLVASGVCKSDDPKSVLMDFAINLV
jgi:triosephosphate isomerase